MQTYPQYLRYHSHEEVVWVYDLLCSRNGEGADADGGQQLRQEEYGGIGTRHFRQKNIASSVGVSKKNTSGE